MQSELQVHVNECIIANQRNEATMHCRDAKFVFFVQH